MGSVGSSVGQWQNSVTIGWVLYDLTGSATLLGLINGMRSFAMLGIGPIAGVVVDRMDRRILLMATKVLLFTASLVVGLLLALDRMAMWHLFAFMFLFGVAQAFDQPLRQTIVFDLVPRRLIPNAIALMTVAMNSTRPWAPALAGFMIAWFGPEGNFFFQSAAYVGVLVTILMMVFPRRGGVAKGGSVLHNFLEGLSYVVKEPTTRTFALLGLVPFILVIPVFNTLMPIFAKDVFHGGPQALGILLGAIGIGGALGPLVSASLVRFQRRGLLQIVTLLGMSITLVGLGLTNSFYVAIFLMVLGGFCEMEYMTTNMTVLQLSIPDELRGRVTSVLMLRMGLMFLGALFAGVGADLYGVKEIVVAMGGLTGVIAVLVALASPRVRHLRLSDVAPSAGAAGGPVVPAAVAGSGAAPPA